MTESKYVQTLHSIPKETFLVRLLPCLTDISSVHLQSNFYPTLHPPLVGQLRYGQRGKIAIPAWRTVEIKSEKYVSAFRRNVREVADGQLEYLVADARAKGCDTLVSVGGVQSNHTRAVTATATACGMKGTHYPK